MKHNQLQDTASTNGYPEKNHAVYFIERLENAGIRPYHLLLAIYGIMIFAGLLLRVLL